MVPIVTYIERAQTKRRMLQWQDHCRGTLKGGTQEEEEEEEEEEEGEGEGRERTQSLLL